ncbi:MAG: DMT family transporter [Campylobacterota bacterium]|nr:DMT family transporter [Campylobacterota bacterium]
MQNNKPFIYLLIFAMLLWGGGWSALKILTVDLSVEIILFWRFFFMSVAFIPILYFFHKPLSLKKSSIKYILASSVLNILFMLFSFFGIKDGFAGGGSVIITTLTPVMTFLLVALIFRKRVQNFQYIGVFLGIIGGIIMLQLNSLEHFLNSSNIYFLLSAITWAGVTILAQHSHKHIDPIHYSFIIAVIATITTFIYGQSSNLLVVFEQDSRFWIALIYLAVFGQAVATTIFFIASGKLGSEITSSFMFLVPLFALFIAWIVLGEVMQTHIVIGGFISIVAVLFINHSTLIGKGHSKETQE